MVVLYPFAVVIGNNSGPGTLTLEWRVNSGTWESMEQAIYFTILMHPMDNKLQEEPKCSLMENWRKYLAENESKYFPWIDDLYSDPQKFIQDQHDKGGFVGSGSFRTVVIPDEDKDFVVKILRYSEKRLLYEQSRKAAW